MFAFHKRLRRGVGALAMAGTLTLGACAISTQQEQQIGQQYAAQINSELPIMNEASANRYLNQLGSMIASHGGRNIPYQFYIVNSEVVNAFAVPGGYVYLNRGLIEATDNLSELAGVVAHEIAHVERRHSVEQLERAQGANVGLTLAYVLLGRQPSGVERAAINVGGGLYFASHSREAENEADAMAVQLLVDSGIDPRGLATFFDELMRERQRRPSQLEQWFSTHPLTEDRITNVQRLISQVPASRMRGLQTNSNAYQSFKSTVSRHPVRPQSR